MRLIHFSSTPMAGVWPTAPFQAVGPKPKGLWVSDEDEYGWREWCTGEDYGTDRLKVAHEITLADDATILRITAEYGIDEFTRMYRATGYERDGYRLNWPEIATVHQGILITPYVGNRRLSMHCGWYYPWDCASGCIWDSEAIESFRVVELAPLEASDA